MNVEIKPNQFFVIEDDELKLATEKVEGIVAITDYVVQHSALFSKETDKNKLNNLKNNLIYLREKGVHHNGKFLVKLFNIIYLSNVFTSFKECDIKFLDDEINKIEDKLKEIKPVVSSTLPVAQLTTSTPTPMQTTLPSVQRVSEQAPTVVSSTLPVTKPITNNDNTNEILKSNATKTSNRAGEFRDFFSLLTQEYKKLETNNINKANAIQEIIKWCIPEKINEKEISPEMLIRLEGGRRVFALLQNNDQKTLDLSGFALRTLPEFLSTSIFADKIEVLNLKNNDIRMLDCKPFKYLKELIVDDNLNFSVLYNFENLIKLEIISLRNCAKFRTIIRSEFSKLENLKSLVLVNTQLGEGEALSITWALPEKAKDAEIIYTLQPEPKPLEPFYESDED